MVISLGGAKFLRSSNEEFAPFPRNVFKDLLDGLLFPPTQEIRFRQEDLPWTADVSITLHFARSGETSGPTNFDKPICCTSSP